jgi:hypothetical protein
MYVVGVLKSLHKNPAISRESCLIQVSGSRIFTPDNRCKKKRIPPEVVYCIESAYVINMTWLQAPIVMERQLSI